MSRQVTITVRNYSNVDLAIAEAVLRKLGLKTAQSRASFIQTYGYKDLVQFFKNTVNSPINQTVKASIIGKIKKYGTCVVVVETDEKLIADIKEFLAVGENKFTDRVRDGVKQTAVGNQNAVDGIKKNVVEAGSDLDKGAGRALHGLWNSMTAPVVSDRFSQGARDVRDGLYQFGTGLFKLGIQTPFDSGLITIGADIDRWQTWLGIEKIGRSLNARERVILMSVFGGSVNYDAVIIKEGFAGLYNLGEDRDAQGRKTYTNNQRALTRGNTIYMKNETVGSQGWNSTLVHEMTHVWQNQNGGTDYMSEALYAQIFGEGYDYVTAIVKQNKSWAMLNPEQQGKLIQDAYDNNFFARKVWANAITFNNATISAQDLTNYMLKVLPQLHAGQGAT